MFAFSNFRLKSCYVKLWGCCLLPPLLAQVDSASLGEDPASVGMPGTPVRAESISSTRQDTHTHWAVFIRGGHRNPPAHLAADLHSPQVLVSYTACLCTGTSSKKPRSWGRLSGVRSTQASANWVHRLRHRNSENRRPRLYFTISLGII